jgi:hypothetical protein
LILTQGGEIGTYLLFEIGNKLLEDYIRIIKSNLYSGSADAASKRGRFI